MAAEDTRVPFEEALNKTGFSRYNVWMFTLCVSIIVSTTFEIYSDTYLVEASSCELNTSSQQQNLISNIPLIGMLMTTHLWGYLADEKGRRKILMISLCVSFIGGTAATFSPNWIVLIIFKLIASASVSSAMATTLTLLSECTPAAHRSTLVILTMSAYFVAVGLMAVIAKSILPLVFSHHIPVLNIYFNSWRLLNLIFAVPCAISAILCIFAYESPKYLICAGRDEDALEVLKKIYVMNTRNSVDTYKVSSLELEEVQYSSSNKKVFRAILDRTLPMVKPPMRRYFTILSSLFTISYITMVAFFVWTPFIINAIMKSAGSGHLTICDMIRLSSNSNTETQDCPIDTKHLIFVFSITMILATYNIVMGNITYCISRKYLFIGIQLVAGLAGLLINTSPFWILSSVMFTIFLSAIINIGFLNSYTVEVFPTYYRASAMCLTPMGGRGNAMLAINILKRVLDSNCEIAFYVFAAIAFGGGLLGLLLPSEKTLKEHKKMLKPEDSHE